MVKTNLDVLFKDYPEISKEFKKKENLFEFKALSQDLSEFHNEHWKALINHVEKKVKSLEINAAVLSLFLQRLVILKVLYILI